MDIFKSSRNLYQISNLAFPISVIRKRIGNTQYFQLTLISFLLFDKEVISKVNGNVFVLRFAILAKTLFDYQNTISSFPFPELFFNTKKKKSTFFPKYFNFQVVIYINKKKR